MAETTGGCLCGNVKYKVDGPMRVVRFCHCETCRKTSGHFVAATACAETDFSLLEDSGLRWYQSSPGARRGFCSTCGSSVLWRPEGGSNMHIMAGTVDRPTGLRAEEHIYVLAASDYYTIDDGLPQYAEYNPDHTVI